MTRRLVVERRGVVVEQGTAWFVTPRLAVTAFHVVGNCTAEQWAHELDGERAYALVDNEGRVPLEALAFCAATDIAVLRAATDTGARIPLAHRLPARRKWEATGFPGFNNGQAFALHGTVSAVDPRDSARAVQLLVEQNTNVEWSGISGSAVWVEREVAALVTSVTHQASTVWAAPASAIRRVVELAASIDEALRLWPDDQALTSLVGANHARAMAILRRHADDRIRALAVTPTASNNEGPVHEPLRIEQLNTTELRMLATQLLDAVVALPADAPPVITVTISAIQHELRIHLHVARDRDSREGLEHEVRMVAAHEKGMRFQERQLVTNPMAQFTQFFEEKLEEHRSALATHRQTLIAHLRRFCA